MSIYLIKKELNFILPQYQNPLPRIKTVATYYEEDEKKYLYYDNYSEEVLISIIENKKYKKIKVHYYFWNYNYCTVEQIRLEDKKALLDGIETYIFDYQKGFLGSLLNLISMNQILLNTFKILKVNVYQEYLSKVNIDKTFFANYIISENLKLPLTENFFILVKRLFNSENILNLVFNKSVNMQLEDFNNLVQEMDFGSINRASYFVYNSKIDMGKKLLYMNTMIDYYNQYINGFPITYIAMDNFKPYIGFYLYLMEVPTKLKDLYFKVLRNYYDNGGSQRFIITDNKEMNQKMEDKYQFLKEVFDLKETFSYN